MSGHCHQNKPDVAYIFDCSVTLFYGSDAELSRGNGESRVHCVQRKSAVMAQSMKLQAKGYVAYTYEDIQLYTAAGTKSDASAE
jgi:hypothetical protein